MLSLEIIDEKWGPGQLEAQLRKFDGEAVYVGNFDQVVAERGYRHETGEGVPTRPWLGPATDAATEEALRVAAREFGASFEGAQTPTEALDETGGVFEQAARAYVRDGKVKGKDLSDAAKRRDPRKLVHSGEMTGDGLETKVAKSIPGEDA